MKQFFAAEVRDTNLASTCILCGVIFFMGFMSPSSVKTVKIGDQVWMAENLNVSKFSNGDLIPEIKSDVEWEKAIEARKPAWCYNGNDPKNGKKYGKLYNWHAVNDPRGLAPKGWHVPTDEEWTTLANYLGGEETAGIKMKSQSGWDKNGNGTNSSGFNGLPGGDRYKSFQSGGSNGYWWSSTGSVTESDEYEENTYSAWYRALNVLTNNLHRYDSEQKLGLSVRCVKD